MDYEPENNLDLTNEAISWGDNPNREDSHRNIGNTALVSPEAHNISSSSSGLDKQIPELGKIVDTEPAPPIAKQVEQALNPSINFDGKLIRTEGDHVSKATLKEVSKAEAKLSQDGNIADFYSTVRGMMEANLDNSYNRKLAA